MAERLLLLDGHSLAYRAFYGLPAENFVTTSGQVTNAVYGFTSMLLTTLEQFQPTHIAVAFDVNRNTFRREQFPEYKANRAATPPEFKGQTELVTEVLDVLGIRHAALEGYEADDIIATWATAAAQDGVEVMILTGDRDALQLVNDRITVLYPRKGVSDLVQMTPEAVFEKYGVTPQQYPDVAAMRGDSSDNLPGIPGVGEKTAANWLNTYGDLQNLVKHADELKGKVGEAFRTHASQALLNRQLTELVRTVPGLLDWDALHVQPANTARLHELFDALQFRALRPRALRFVGTDTAAAPAAAATLTVSAADPDAALTLLRSKVPIAIAWTVVGDRVVGLGLAANAESGMYAPMTDDLLRALVDHDALIGHHAKPLVRLLPGLRGWRADTAIMAYLANPGLRATDLAECAQRLLGLSLEASGEHATSLFDEDLSADLGVAAAATFALYEQLHETLEREGAGKLLDELELPLMLLLAAMEHRGIAVDENVLKSLDSEFGSRMQEQEAAAHNIAGEPFNLGSPKQLQEILFNKRGLPKTKRTKTGYTTDAEALQTLFEKTADPLLEHLLQWREVSKLRQTVNGLLPQIDAQGRIHTTFQQTVAATGRLASTEPNLQNIPVRTADGRRIRHAFVPGEGFDVLMTADYSQIEMRIMAHLSGDQRLIDAFHSGEDLHTTVAAQVFAVKPGEVDADMRRRIKAMSYGLAYGLSAYGLAQQLAVDPAEAQRLMDSYFERFGRVRDYLRDVVATARTTGYTETMFGRRRYLPDLNSDQRVRRELAERMALNAPIQGTAADIIKRAMLRVQQALEISGVKSRLLLQVHDELVLECPQSEVHEVSALVQAEMGRAADLSVPLDVSVGVGHNWDQAAH
jgi:DNA polymerase-1